MSLEHRLLRPGAVEDRPYQRLLADRVVGDPHLLVLPTGLGKTVIALRAILHHLDSDAERRVLVLAPTKPLCDQHARFFGEALIGIPVVAFTGETPPARRDGEWRSSRVIVATPQVVQNDLVRGARDLSDVGFVVYDEAHRAAGQYPYGFIARRYRASGGRAALGLTASPGNDAAAVDRVLRTLQLERLEVRTEHDPDVAPYVHEVTTEWVRLRPTPASLRAVRLLERMYVRCVVLLRRLGRLPNIHRLPGRRELIHIGQELRSDAASRAGGRGTYEAMSVYARALKIQHGLELAETQGSTAAHAFLRRLEHEASTPGSSKAARDLVREPEFAEALAVSSVDAGPSPKVGRIVELVRSSLAGGHRRVLVFANYRETADAIVSALGGAPGARVSRFVGHARSAGERGLTKREQAAIVERFRAGDLNVLVATAVGEEGLDLPETDAVVLHEPVPSAIRLIQRRGRTGRQGDGRLWVLLYEGTRDEAYHWNALRRHRRMEANLAALKRRPLPLPLGYAGASDPPAAIVPRDAGDLELTMDPREAGSPLARILIERGLRVRTATLPTGDFAIGNHILVERKRAADFAASVKDGRLLEQLPRLARAGRGVLLVEGEPLRDTAGLAPTAVAGALAAAAADHGVSVVTVPGPESAADFLVSLARRTQRMGTAGPERIAKTPRAPDAQLRFVLEGVPGVGPVVARNLLDRFGAIAAIAEASEVELAATSGVGPERARVIHEVLHRRCASPGLGGAPVAAQLGPAPLESGEGAAR